MNTMNIPGFTADASFFKTAGFGMATVALSENNTDSVQPAMRASCVILFRLWADSEVYENSYGQAFFLGALLGAGCFG